MVNVENGRRRCIQCPQKTEKIVTVKNVENGRRRWCRYKTEEIVNVKMQKMIDVMQMMYVEESESKRVTSWQAQMQIRNVEDIEENERKISKRLYMQM